MELPMALNVKVIPSFKTIWEVIPILLEQRDMKSFQSDCHRFLEILNSEQESLSSFLDELEEAEPLKKSPGRQNTPSSSPVYERWLSAVLLARTILVIQNRFRVALGVDDAYTLELHTQKLALDTLALYRAYPNPMGAQVIAPIVVPPCHAVLLTARRWSEWLNPEAASSKSKVTAELVRSWLSHTPMLPRTPTE